MLNYSFYLSAMAILEESTLIMALVLYFECKSSYKQFKIQWVHKRVTTVVPSRKFMYRLAQRFKTTGTIHKRKPTGRKKIVRTTDNVYAVAQKIVEVPGISARTCAKVLDLPNSVVLEILHKELKWKPWKPRLVHKLHEHDYKRRYWFCDTMIKFLEMEKFSVTSYSSTKFLSSLTEVCARGICITGMMKTLISSWNDL